MKVAVFDSGVGGLTVLAEIHRVLPGHDTVYLGDTARVPYGTRSRDTIVRYAERAARFLVDRSSPDVLVVACNTASAVALEALEAQLKIPVLGVIQPAVETALELTASGRIGVLATRGTVRSGAYERALLAHGREGAVVTPAPLFVPMAEEGMTDPQDPVVVEVARRYLEPHKQGGVDTLILGCTHYPLMARAITEVMGADVRLAAAGPSVAKQLQNYGACPATAGQRQYFVTDAPSDFHQVTQPFLGHAAPEPELVDLT